MSSRQFKAVPINQVIFTYPFKGKATSQLAANFSFGVSVHTLIFLILIASICSASIIATTEGGRKVILNKDKTWSYISAPQADDWTQLVQFTSFEYEHLSEDYLAGRVFAQVRVYFQFRNLSDKTITGLIYKIKYKDGFGDVIYQTKDGLKDHIVLEPNQTNPMDQYWCYEEGFDDDTLYALLKSPAYAGTLKVSISISKIAFSDETIMDFPKEVWVSPLTQRKKEKVENAEEDDLFLWENL